MPRPASCRRAWRALVAGHRQHGPHLSLARVSISSRMTAAGRLAAVLRDAAHAAAPQVVVPAPRSSRGVTKSIAGSVNSTPPGWSKWPVRMLRHWMPHCARDPNPVVETPMRPYAAPPSAAASSLARRRCRPRRCRDPLGGLGGEGLDELAHAVDPVDVRRRAGQALLEQRAHHRQHAPRRPSPGGRRSARPRPRGLGAARVDDDHPATARLEGAQPVGEAGRGHQPAVRGHRVGAEHQEVRRAVDVGDRQQELVAVQLPGDQWCGIWSTDEALNRLRVRSIFTMARPWVAEPRECALGLPR